jgi:hypothetical protein
MDWCTIIETATRQKFRINRLSISHLGNCPLWDPTISLLALSPSCCLFLPHLGTNKLQCSSGINIHLMKMNFNPTKAMVHICLLPLCLHRKHRTDGKWYASYSDLSYGRADELFGTCLNFPSIEYDLYSSVVRDDPGSNKHANHTEPTGWEIGTELNDAERGMVRPRNSSVIILRPSPAEHSSTIKWGRYCIT